MALKDSFARAEQRVHEQNSAATGQAQLQRETIGAIERNIELTYNTIAETLYRTICDQVAEKLIIGQGQRVTASGYVSDFYNSLTHQVEVISPDEYDRLRRDLDNPDAFFESVCKKYKLEIRKGYYECPVMPLSRKTTAYTGGFNIIGEYTYYRMFLTQHGKEVVRHLSALAHHDNIAIRPFVLQTRRKSDKYGNELWTKHLYKHLGSKLKEPEFSNTHASHMLAIHYSYTGRYRPGQSD